RWRDPARRPGALGTDPGLADRSVPYTRPCPRRDPGRTADVPRGVSPAAWPGAGERLLRVARRAQTALLGRGRGRPAVLRGSVGGLSGRGSRVPESGAGDSPGGRSASATAAGCRGPARLAGGRDYGSPADGAAAGARTASARAGTGGAGQRPEPGWPGVPDPGLTHLRERIHSRTFGIANELDKNGTTPHGGSETRDGSGKRCLSGVAARVRNRP